MQKKAHEIANKEELKAAKASVLKRWLTSLQLTLGEACLV